MKKRNSIVLSVVGIVVLVIAFYQTPIMDGARGIAWSAWVHGVARVFGIGGIDSNPGVISSMQELRLENIRLRAELKNYGHIREQLGSPSFDNMRAIPAEVISRPIDTQHASFVINKGVDDGATAGAPVIVQGSVLVGFIRELSGKTSVVETLLHPAVNITVETIKTDDETPIARGSLRSRYRTMMYMTTVPRDAPLDVGNDVVSASKGAEIPYGMIIGTVADVRDPENEAYQEAKLKVPYDLDSVDSVMIMVVE